jgi:hypothetical protein
VAAGDFDRDGYDDLAISIPGEDLGGVSNAGRAIILYGSTNGLSSARSQAWVQGLYDVRDMYEENDYFGKSMATGNRFWHQDSQYIEGASEYNDHFGCSLAAIPPRKHLVYVPALLRRHQEHLGGAPDVARARRVTSAGQAGIRSLHSSRTG